MDFATGAPFRRIPTRTIVGALALVALLQAVLSVLVQTRSVLTWIVIAAFFAVVLSGPVELLQNRFHLRRGLAIGTVFIGTFMILGALLYAFIAPLASASTEFIDDFPEFVQDAKEGKGAVGDVVERFNLEQELENSEDQIRRFVRVAQGQALGIVAAVGNTVAGILTIIVLTFFMLLEGPAIVAGALKLMGPGRAERVRPVAQKCTRAVAGYMTGNLLVSVIAGISTFIFLTVLDVPFAGVLALWVAVADLIPLLGATLGAIPTVGIAFIASPAQGVATLIFYILYQQLENHLLQPTIMSRAVHLSPLTVLISVLLGVQTFGILGALLAIPVAAMVQVILRDYWEHHDHHLAMDPEPEPPAILGADGAALDDK